MAATESVGVSSKGGGNGPATKKDETEKNPSASITNSSGSCTNGQRQQLLDYLISRWVGVVSSVVLTDNLQLHWT